ncbi:Rossmann-like and DUF2520 domain-containing protein [Ilumatobacter nonamiensis]|uniref:Rossmann-like and DUF2520 domain-containing protein n=1 Tax=Ilumatobacter nonamiensis TaxID=467093 RepID=UPI000347EEF6|nr:Rossmann-like and DUF2520 domain-containing protein [Ilumatobacter nonamiensis]
MSSRDLSEVPRAVIERAEVVLLAVADGAIADVARHLAARGAGIEGVVAHCSGACALDVLAPHARVASVHPLMSLPDPEIGSARLLDACTFAVAGDSAIVDVVEALGGRPIDVPTTKRATYHAAASVAANHLTALCAQVERLANDAEVPVDAFWPLMTTTLSNVADVGPTAALTGPASRGDWDTVRDHVAAIPESEQTLYLVLCERAATIAGQQVPHDLRVTPRV